MSLLGGGVRLTTGPKSLSTTKLHGNNSLTRSACYVLGKLCRCDYKLKSLPPTSSLSKEMSLVIRIRNG